MRSFVDTQSRRWTITVDVGAIRRVRALCGIDLLSIIAFKEETQEANTDLLEKLSSDPVLLVDVLYAICKPDADAQNISDEEFGRALSGDIIEDATHILLDEVVDFFPEAKRRVYQKILTAARRFEKKQTAALMAFLDNEELDAEINSRLEKLNGTFTNAPGSAE